MKTAVVSLYASGGMIHYASQLCNALSGISSVHLIASDKVNRELFSAKVNLHTVPVPERMLRPGVLKFEALFRTINSIVPDVIHITAIHAWPILGFPRLRRYPLVITLHDIKMHPGEWDPLTVVLTKMATRIADRLFVHSSRLKAQLVAEGISEERIEVIPLGDFSFLTRYEKDGVEEQDEILFFGRIERYKGLEYLIRAQPRIKAAFPGARIVIAGQGSFSRYERLIGHRDGFQIMNKFIPDEEIAPLFQRAKLVVLPYIEASQSAVVAIAYAFRKPVVVTNVGSIPEIVKHGETGLIVPPGNSDALAEAIIELLGHDDRRRAMGNEAFVKMERELSWDNVAQKTLQVYEQVCRQRAARN